MIDGEIMDNLEMLYEDDYLKYQEFITRNMDLDDSKIVFVSGLDGSPFEKLHDGDNMKCIRELLENSEKPFAVTVYIRKGDIYQKIEVTFNSEGVINSSEPQIIESFDDIVEGLEHSEVIGNADEYIKILQLRGEKEKADLIQRKYEYFMNNKDRIPEIREEMAKPSPDRIQFDAIVEMIRRGETLENESDLPKYDDKGTIEFKGIVITENGLIYKVNECAVLTIKVDSEQLIKEIEEAVKNGELTLNEEQQKTLLNAKKEAQSNLSKDNEDSKIGEEDFEEVAESSIEESEQVFNELRTATKEEQEQYIDEQGE